MADETTQGVHPFTTTWWDSLPTPYKRADRAQGYRLTDAWHGLNRDPRFITGWDGWYRANTSTAPWQASVSFTRSFQATPNVPVHIRSWHHPYYLDADGNRVPLLEGTRIRHVVRNYTGNVIADTTPTGSSTGGAYNTVDAGQVVVGNEDIYDGGTVTDVIDPTDAGTSPDASTDTVNHHTFAVPDRYGVITVTIHVEVDVPDARDLVQGIHVGNQDVTFGELPAADYFATAAAYPLLRYMDGIGHQAGFLSDMANQMHNGQWTDPETSPESYLPFLASVLGVPRQYSDRLTRPQLRQHLVDMIEGNSPTPGSRDHIAITAKQWLTGTKEVSVQPAHMVEGFTGADPVHSIVITARADEVPNNDLAAFAQFLNDSGVVPAGHRIVIREGTPSWDQWQQVAGITWDDKAKVIHTWNDSDSAGLDLSGEGA